MCLTEVILYVLLSVACYLNSDFGLLLIITDARMENAVSVYSSTEKYSKDRCLVNLSLLGVLMRLAATSLSLACDETHVSRARFFTIDRRR